MCTAVQFTCYTTQIVKVTSKTPPAIFHSFNLMLNIAHITKHVTFTKILGVAWPLLFP